MDVVHKTSFDVIMIYICRAEKLYFRIQKYFCIWIIR